jgi:hypothetical protein
MARSTLEDRLSATLNWKSGWPILSAAIILFVAFISFYPRPVIATADKSSQRAPSNVVVTLSNNSVVRLRKVKVWLDNRDIDTVGGEIKNFPFAAMLWQAPTLRADDKPAISLDSGF